VKEDDRRIVITERASVIRNAFSVLLTGIESEGDATPGTREILQEFSKQDCHNLILDLREVEEPFAGAPIGIRNLHASRVGRVLVVICEIDAPRIFQQIENLCRPRFFPKQWTSGLAAFMHMFF
jgi:hypothetical protein